jgi:nucleotide-binding universal stress UspA family protein
MVRWEADLVVLGTRGVSGIAAVRAGSIATSLATHTPASVLMARAGRWPAPPEWPADAGAQAG